VNISAVSTVSATAGGQASVAQARPLPEISPTPPAGRTDGDARQREVKRIVEKMQEQIDNMNVSLQYSTYGDHGEKIAISVVNKETGELIREIPSEELRNLYARMSELEGMIFNKVI
jgi:flagellar protein FlaG